MAKKQSDLERFIESLPGYETETLEGFVQSNDRRAMDLQAQIAEIERETDTIRDELNRRKNAPPNEPPKPDLTVEQFAFFSALNERLNQAYEKSAFRWTAVDALIVEIAALPEWQPLFGDMSVRDAWHYYELMTREMQAHAARE